MFRLPKLSFRRRREPRPRKRHYAYGDEAGESGTRLVFGGLFVLIAGIIGYAMGVPFLHHGLSHASLATLSGLLPSLHHLLPSLRSLLH